MINGELMNICRTIKSQHAEIVEHIMRDAQTFFVAAIIGLGARFRALYARLDWHDIFLTSDTIYITAEISMHSLDNGRNDSLPQTGLSALGYQS